MNAEKEIETTVIPIGKGKEIRSRRAGTQSVAEDPQKVTMRRLMQCVLMAVELVEEATRKQ